MCCGQHYMMQSQVLQGVKNSDALRALVDQLQPEQIRISQRLSQSSPLYSKFQAIRNASDSWSETETRVLDNLITSAKLAGAALEVGDHLLCVSLGHAAPRVRARAVVY